MKYKFILTQITNVPSIIQWGWLIDNTLSLMEFIEIKQKRQAVDYFKAKKEAIKNEHCIESGTCAINWLFTIKKAFSENKKTTIIDDFYLMHDEFIKPIIETYKETGGLFVWSNLFAFAPTGGYTYLKEITKSKLIFPGTTYSKEDIRIIQWRGGKHWYAKIGNYDVEINNNSKWDTYNSAYKAACNYLKEYENNTMG
jgi:hypothetical protein